MTTGALSAAFQDIITTNGWATRKIMIDSGSSLITAVKETSGAVADLKDEEDGHEDATVDNQQTKELLKGLRNEGFEIKIPFSKASFHQAKIKLIIKPFKVCLRAVQL